MAVETEKYDIVIIGAGPVGLLLSTCLARWGYKIKHIDLRAEATITGRADGIQPRTLDLLRNMGLRKAVEAYEPGRVCEVAFWNPRSDSKGIYRTGNSPSCPPYIDSKNPWTTTLHQGFIEQIFIDELKKHNVQIQRPWHITGFDNDGADKEYPIQVSIAHVEGSAHETIRSKYLFSAEGAKSFIRDQLGIGITYKSPIEYHWGVMDCVVRTNFPDIRLKCTIHSDDGSFMIIPREARMVRLYIQMDFEKDADGNVIKTNDPQDLVDSVKRKIAPYWIEWDRIEWWSVYAVGQGLADRYSLDERVFLGGDCCHTHSPKAGQGMNTAFLDASNLAWKIHLVEAGFADRTILKSYEGERRHIAEKLLDFDARYAKLFSQKHPPSAAQVDGEDKGDSEFVKTFKEATEFTTGYGIEYLANDFNWSESHSAKSDLFLSISKGTTRLKTGRILLPATVRRVSDAHVVDLEQEIPLNGAFRIYIFGGRPSYSKRAIWDLASHLEEKGSFFTTYARADLASVDYHEGHIPHSRFFTLATIFNADRSHIEIQELLPSVLARYRDHIYADDVWDPRVPDAKAAAHAKMGLSEEEGGVVVVRPDGYVACVIKLVEGSGTVDALNQYFAAFCTKRIGSAPVAQL